MSITDELERLGRLHKDGTLSDEEFAQAKSKLLNQPADSGPPQQDNSLGQAANRYVSLQMVMSVIGIIIFLIFLFAVILPAMNRSRGPTFPQPTITITPNR
jgi:hypothetical protein